MLSRMKPLPKAIILFALVAGVVAIGNFALNRFAPDVTKNLGNAMTSDTKTVGTTQAVSVKSADALNVSIVSFHGYAPGIVANGGALKTQAGSIFANLGVKVNFVIQDNVPTLSEIFESNTAQCAWRTSDFWAQEQPNLRNAGHDGRAVMIVDNTQGGDAIIAKDPSIKSVEDLAGRSVALLQFTPSHGLLIDAIDNSSMTPKKKQSVRYVFINADEGTAGVRAAFESGKVDAAVLWDPDLALALRSGGHVVYSTKTAQNLIYDVMVCDSRVLATAEGKAKVAKFVKGWMEGVTTSRANPDLAVAALVNTQEMFKLLSKSEGDAFIKGLFNSVVWTGLEDNARILGLAGGTNHYERVYAQFDDIYRDAGALANPNSPVIPAQNSFDYSFIQELLQGDRQAQELAKREVNTFTAAGAAQATRAAVTKPVTINFEIGSAELTARAKKTIDTEMVPFIENNGAAYVEISGHTDSTGSAAANLALSKRRADAVSTYLKTQWEIPAARLKTEGYGSTRPICVEPGTSDGLTLDECRALNRSTRTAILGR